MTEASGTYSKETWLPYFTSRTNKYTNEINYDEIGNITRKAQVNTGTYEGNETKNLIDTTYTWDYAYGSTRPHAVTNTGDISYTYDASGNMTNRVNSTTGEYMKLTWDDENRLTKTEDNLNSTTYRYDDTGTRIAKKGKFGETIYASDIFTVKNGTIESTHIFAGQTRIATKVKNTSTGTTSTTPVDMGVYYYHPDHLGSSSTVTNDKGKFTEHTEYFPYGEIWVTENNSDTTLPYKFTAKELDSETGLYYYGARYMDPKLGRFVSIDPPLVTGDYLPTGDKDKDKNLPGEGGVFKSINLNPFHYGSNNPVVFVDPNGMWDDKSKNIVWYKGEMGGVLNQGRVTDGDSLWSLAEMQLKNEGDKTTGANIAAKVEKIKLLNRLDSDKISKGQNLTLGISQQHRRRLVPALGDSYIDYNVLTATYISGFTSGVCVDNWGDIYVYFGGAIGKGVSTAISGSHNALTEGMTISLSCSYGYGTAQYGYTWDYNGKPAGGALSLGVTKSSGFSFTLTGVNLVRVGNVRTGMGK